MIIVNYESGTAPNGLKISKSVLPAQRIGFNEWAQKLNVSGGYNDPTLPSVPAMEMINRYRLEEPTKIFGIF